MNSRKSDLGNKPIVVIVGLISSCLAIFTFLTGWQDFRQMLSETLIRITPLVTPVIEVSSPTKITTSVSSNLIVFEKWIKCESEERWGCVVELWTVGIDGTNLHQITQGYYDTSPSFSPNGQFVAFSRIGTDTEGIFLIYRDGTNVRRISSNQRAYDPQWATNNSIVFASPRGPEQEAIQRWRLYSVSIDNLNEQIIDLGISGAFSPSLSPDRMYVAFHGGDGYIYIANTDGTNITQIETTQGPIQGYPLQWHPDSQHFVAVRDSECLKVSLDGTVEPLFGIDECNFSWSPDGSQITYEFNYAIWLMNSDGNNKRLLVKPSDDSLYKSPVWAP